jgi:hypothetical protein
MAAAAPLPALVNAHDGVQIGVCTAFSKSKARATPGLAPGPLGLGLFHQGLTCTRRGRWDAVGFAAWGAGDENRRQVSAGCQYSWHRRPSRSMEESGVLEMKLHCRESSSRCHNRSCTFNSRIIPQHER